MRRSLIAFVTILAIGGTATTTAVASPTEPTTKCATVKQHNQLAKRALRVSIGGVGGDYRGHVPTERQLDRLGAMRACMKQQDRAKYKMMRGAWDKRADKNRYYRHIDSITPCGEWIACGITEHESATSGYYTAHNPTGCYENGVTYQCFGAYQISGRWWQEECGHLNWNIPAEQHECGHIVKTLQGMGAWGM